MTSKAKSVFVSLCAVLLIGLAMLIAVVAFPTIVGGNGAYIVTSDSMNPTIESGDVIVTKDVDPDEVESGDVVTFSDGTGADAGYVTHRVVDVVEEDGERYLQLQGDANDEPDEGYVPVEYARGEHHLTIPLLGYALVFARSSLGLVMLVVLPGLALVASGSLQFLRGLGYDLSVERVFERMVRPGEANSHGDVAPPRESYDESTEKPSSGGSPDE